MRKLHLTKGEIALLLAAIAYIVMPVDFIPELVAGPLGLTDDVAAVALIAATVSRARNRPVVFPGEVPGEPSAEATSGTTEQH